MFFVSLFIFNGPPLSQRPLWALYQNRFGKHLVYQVSFDPCFRKVNASKICTKHQTLMRKKEQHVAEMSEKIFGLSNVYLRELVIFFFSKYKTVICSVRLRTQVLLLFVPGFITLSSRSDTPKVFISERQQLPLVPSHTFFPLLNLLLFYLPGGGGASRV